MVANRSGLPAELLVLQNCLEKLRARDGLTSGSLQGNRYQAAAPLLELASVRRYAERQAMDRTSAAVRVAELCTLGSLVGSQRIVADAVLALGLFKVAYLTANLEARAVSKLYSPSVGKRREALLENWAALHRAVDIEPVPSPSDRTLRGSLEPATLQRLAEALWSFADEGVGADDPLRPSRSREAALPGVLLETAPEPVGRVLVLGGAVMDVTFRTEAMPQLETIEEAHGFNLSPGGKGVTQAVAAARLGLDVALVAAVGDDRFGDEIVSYLQSEGVHTEHIKRVPDTPSAFTGVVEFQFGDSIAVNWRNEVQLHLDNRDVDAVRDELLGADVVLATFEPPLSVVNHALSLILADHDPTPIVVATPAPPYKGRMIGAQVLSRLDYLVARPWELRQFSSSINEDAEPGRIAPRMLGSGLGTLCVPLAGGCDIYSHALGHFSVPGFPSIYKESSVARDAFCAALALQLIENDRDFSEDTALWATAAMATAIADFPVPNSMPTRKRVDAFLGRSRYAVRPKEDG